MATVKVDHGLQVGVYGSNVTAGQFTTDGTATGVSVNDSDIEDSSLISIFPSNALAGLTLRSNTCYVVNVIDGSFNFSVSGAGNANSKWMYIAVNDLANATATGLA